MTSTQQLFDDFRAAFERGDDPDPMAYLERAQGRDRVVLEVLIDRWLEREAPAREYDAAAFAAAMEGQRLRAVAEALARPAPTVRERREHAGLTLRALAERVLEIAGVRGDPARAEGYLARVEAGELSLGRISSRAREAIVTALGGPVGDATAPAPAFRAGGAPLPQAAATVDVLADLIALPSAGARDEVDELFLGP